MSHDYKAWYAQNKQKIAAQKKARYENDAEYRAAIRERSRLRRQAANGDAPHGFVLSLADAAAEVDITVWTLREWKKKSYFPTPNMYSGKIMFTPNQIEQLKRLKQFFDFNGVRTDRYSEVNKALMQDLIATIAQNWSM